MGSKTTTPKKPSYAALRSAVESVLTFALAGAEWDVTEVTPPGVALNGRFFKARPSVEDWVAFRSFYTNRIMERFQDKLAELGLSYESHREALDKIEDKLYDARKQRDKQNALEESEKDLADRNRKFEDTCAKRERDLTKREERLKEDIAELEDVKKLLDEKVNEGKAKLELDIESRLRKELKQEAVEVARVKQQLSDADALYDNVTDELERMIAENNEYRSIFVAQFGELHASMRQAMKHPQFTQMIQGLAVECVDETEEEDDSDES